MIKSAKYVPAQMKFEMLCIGHVQCTHEGPEHC